jgi:formylglycine-generating enzyme required for sulfatase activity
MDNETQGQATPPAAGEPKKKTGIFGKIGAFWKSGVKGKVICIVGVLVILGIIGAFTDDEEGGGGSGGGGGGGDWKYTGEYFDSVFEGFPKDEGVIYQHLPNQYSYLPPLKVMQATKKGNLVEIKNSDRVIWVETKRRYEDGELLDRGYYIRRGSKEYETALGAEKTVARYVEVSGSLLEKVKNQIEDEKAAAEAKAKAEAEAQAKSAAEHEAAILKTKAEIAAMQAGKTAGETTTITLPGGETMEMVWCPPGTFTMGCDAETRHQVTLTKGFWMGKTKVTQAQWKSVMGDNPSRFKGDDFPVENVSWDDCQRFCKKLGLQLPTEAQWEYACRAGSAESEAQKNPNAWGLLYGGNVDEWCSDLYGDYPDGAVTDPTGALTSSYSYRVRRGGDPCGRDRAPDFATINNGCRLVRTLSE